MDFFELLYKIHVFCCSNGPDRSTLAAFLNAVRSAESAARAGVA